VRQAEPVDRPIRSHEGRSVQVSDDPVVLYRLMGHSAYSLPVTRAGKCGFRTAWGQSRLFPLPRIAEEDYLANHRPTPEQLVGVGNLLQRDPLRDYRLDLPLTK
jgi:hypothetical protein